MCLNLLRSKIVTRGNTFHFQRKALTNFYTLEFIVVESPQNITLYTFLPFLQAVGLIMDITQDKLSVR